MKQTSETQEIEALLKQNADAERRLLKRERQAEQAVVELRDKLAEAQERLAKEQKRVERRTKALAAAEGELSKQRAARSSGPATPPSMTSPDSEDSADQPSAPAPPVSSPEPEKKTRTAMKEPTL